MSGAPDRSGTVAAGWRVTSASVMGSMHVREHLPNQDRVLTWSDDDGGRAVMAVADGHGHSTHFRSDVGAELAAEAAVDALRALVTRGRVDAVTDDVLAEVAGRVVRAWRSGVQEHIEAHPFPRDRGVRDPMLPYGATLLAVAAAGRPTGRLLFVQIGDGDTVAVRASGAAFRPLPEDPSLDGVHTASMCQPDPLRSFRYAIVEPDDDPVVLAYCCTDGFGRARVDDDWWARTGVELLGFARGRGLPWIAQQLPEWLEEPARIGGDDTTLALLAHGSLGPAEEQPDADAVPPTVPIPMDDDAPATVETVEAREEPPPTVERPKVQP